MGGSTGPQSRSQGSAGPGARQRQSPRPSPPAPWWSGSATGRRSRPRPEIGHRPGRPRPGRGDPRRRVDGPADQRVDDPDSRRRPDDPGRRRGPADDRDRDQRGATGLLRRGQPETGRPDRRRPDDGPSDAPVWQTERDLTCERCVFRATSPAAREPTSRGGADRARGFLAEGPKLAVTGCLFAGFDRPIEFAAGPGASATLDQSIFVAGNPATTPRWSGGRSSSGRLRRRCRRPAQGRRLLEPVRSLPGGRPVLGGLAAVVEVTDSAIWARRSSKSRALAAAGGRQDPGSCCKAVHWRGRSNRFHVPPAEPLGSGLVAEPLATPRRPWTPGRAGGREVNSQAGRSASPTLGQPDRASRATMPSRRRRQTRGADPARLAPGRRR